MIRRTASLSRDTTAQNETPLAVNPTNAANLLTAPTTGITTTAAR
jgi:hypothetical protein